jgi:hypothetical protein
MNAAVEQLQLRLNVVNERREALREELIRHRVETEAAIERFDKEAGELASAIKLVGQVAETAVKALKSRVKK